MSELEFVKALEKSGFVRQQAEVQVKVMSDFTKKLATRDDLDRFATKDDLTRFATKDDLDRFATKDDLTRFATKGDLEKLDLKIFVLSENLKLCATKSDLKYEIELVNTRMDAMANTIIVKLGSLMVALFVMAGAIVAIFG